MTAVKKWFGVCITLLAVLFCMVPNVAFADSVFIGAEEGDTDVIRIGFIVIDNYNYVDVNGQWRGYDIELLMKLSQYGDFKIEGVPFESSADALDSLRTGEVDALIDFNRTEERAAEFLLSSNTVASDKLVVYARSDDNRFTFGDSKQLGGVKIGTIKGSGVNELLPAELEKYGVTPILVPYESVEEINAAFDKGMIDAACSGSNAAPKDYKAVFSFMSDSAYILFTKDNTELCAVLDDAVSTLKTEEPVYLYNLSSKYIVQSASGIVDLTDEEKEFISTLGQVTVALPDDNPPYSYEEDGKMKGIVPEYYEVLGNKTGIDFVFMACADLTEAENAVRLGEADVLGLYYGDIITANYKGFMITSEYSTYECALFCNAGESEENIKKVAATVRTEDVARVQLAQQGIDFEIVSYKNIGSCYDAFKDGEVDGILCSMTSVNWLLNQHSRANASIIVMPEIQIETAGCVSENSELYSILNRAIEASESDFQKLVTENVVTDQDDIKAVIENMPPAVILAVSSVVILILVALIVSLLRLNSRNKERAALAQAEAEVRAQKDLNEKRSAFFSNISHDMRTPLNAIIGFSDIASESNDPEEIHEYLGKIHTSGDVLLNLINDTLTVSKMNNGKLELDIEPASTKQIFSEVTVPIKAAAEAKNISYVESLPEEDYTILCDALNTQKILLNVLTNAIKYTPQRGTVVFECKMEEIAGRDDGVMLCARIADTGIGMDGEFLPKIFEPFAQENNKFGVTSGVGLGLAIVKELVDCMDGTIDVDSKRGVGTTFNIRLPFSKTTQPPKKKAAADAEEIDLSGKNILLCEDNDLNAEIACAILEKYGAHVDVAANGKIGVEYFKKNEEGHYALVLMDLRMPVMDGYEAARGIRALARQDAQTVPIVAMSADAFDDDVKKCKACGMNGHIPKPIDMNKLTDLLKTL